MSAPALFGTIVADPPWFERGGGKIKRGADRHYPLLRTEEIVEVMLTAPCWRPAPNSHIYLWVTNNFLPDGLFLMRALGFRYVTNLVWAKDGAFGLGQYFRGQHELILFGVRGRQPALARNVGTLIRAAKGRHSEKPGALFEIAEHVSPPPRLEMFARQARPRWAIWGNEVPDVIPASPIAEIILADGGREHDKARR